MQQLEQRPKLTVAERFAAETGIDLGKNLWEVLVPSDGRTTWVLLRGKFSEMGMEPRVDKEGAQRLRYKGYTMLGDDRMAVLFLNPTTAVAASPAGLRRIIDNRDTGTGIPKSLQAQINNIPSSNQAWFAGNLREIGQIAGGIDLRAGPTGRLAAAANTRVEAQNFAQMLARLFEGVKVQDKQVKLDVPAHRLDDVVAVLSP